MSALLTHKLVVADDHKKSQRRTNVRSNVVVEKSHSAHCEAKVVRLNVGGPWDNREAPASVDGHVGPPAAQRRHLGHPTHMRAACLTKQRDFAAHPSGIIFQPPRVTSVPTLPAVSPNTRGVRVPSSRPLRSVRYRSS